MMSKAGGVFRQFTVFLVGGLVGVLGCSNQHAELPSGYHDPNSVKTADDLIQELEVQQVRWGAEATMHRSTYLSQRELEIAAKRLQEKYPLRSIRERLHFQANAPKLIAENAAGSSLYDEGYLYSQRSLALSELHSDEVHSFINRNGQGVTRSPLPEPSDLRLWGDYATRIQTVPVDSKILGEAVVELPTDENGEFGGWSIERFSFSSTGMPQPQLVSQFHAITSDGFAGPATTGYVRSVDDVAGFNAHQVRLDEADLNRLRLGFQKDWADDEKFQRLQGLDITWKTNRIQLLGLLMHDQPVVYESENLPNMEELSSANAKTRPLNSFEINSLAKLKGGEDLVTIATRNRIVMLGAIRADGSCLQCHSVKHGDLLGAFSYEFLRHPRAPESDSRSEAF